jgi:hypothetical protein
MGSSGPPRPTPSRRAALNRIAGTKMRLVHGYKGSGEVHIAMERGEVQGRCGLGWDSIVSRYQHWIKDKKVAVLAQFALRKHPDIPNVISILDLAQKAEDKQLVDVMLAPLEMGRPYFAPPNVPADRVEALRRAFDATSKDPEFLADVKKQKMELSPLTGERWQRWWRFTGRRRGREVVSDRGRELTENGLWVPPADRYRRQGAGVPLATPSARAAATPSSRRARPKPAR